MLSASAKDAQLYYKCVAMPMLVIETLYLTAFSCQDNQKGIGFGNMPHLVVAADTLQNGSLGGIHDSGVCNNTQESQ